MSELGEITRCYSLRYERRSKHSVERVWRAITDPAEVSQWMSYPARIELRIGGDFFVDFSRTNEGCLEGVVVRVEPGRRLAYVWGLSVVEWTLGPDGSGCRYTLVHHGMSRREIPEEEGVAVGWHLFLDDFGRHLEGDAPIKGPAGESALRAPYRKQLDEVLGSGA